MATNKTVLEGQKSITNHFGPIAQTKLSLMGIRFIEGEGGNVPATEPVEVETVTPVEKTTEENEPKTDEVVEPIVEKTVEEETPAETEPTADEDETKFKAQTLTDYKQGLTRARELRNEAASNRKKIEAKDSEIEALKAEVNGFKSEASKSIKLKILSDNGLPESHLKFIELAGDNEAEWIEAAKELASGNKAPERVATNRSSTATGSKTDTPAEVNVKDLYKTLKNKR